METLLRNEKTATKSFESYFEQNYKVLEFLGKGAFGDVYKCTPTTNHQRRVVAVKLVEFKENSVQKAEQEATILEKLDHPYVVKFFKHWIENPPKKYKYPDRHPMLKDTEGIIFIETEFCDLNSLHSWFAEKTLRRNDAKIIFYQITQGVSFLHENKIVHRDLKPENILLCSQPSSDSVVAKICDFGVSREIKTKMTSQIGTFGYMSPESSPHGGNNYTEKADIYSLGIIFCEMLHLSDPEKSDTNLVTMKICVNGFKILPSCREEIGLSEAHLIEDMVQVPFEKRPPATKVIKRLVAMYSDIDNQILCLSDIQSRIKEKPGVYKLQGSNSAPKIFEEIPSSKLNSLTVLDLNYVIVNAPKFISSLKNYTTLISVNMIVINENDCLYDKIDLPNLKNFFYRQLNGPMNTEALQDYLSEGKVQSFLFFGPLQQIWECKMNVRVTVTKFTIIDIRHDKSTGCSIHVAASAATERVYDNFIQFENVDSIVLIDLLSSSELVLDMAKFPNKGKMKTLAVALPAWNKSLYNGLADFTQLTELYLSSFSRKFMRANVDSMRHIELSTLPKTLKNLTLDYLYVNLKHTKVLTLDVLSLLHCVFYNNYKLEDMNAAAFKVKRLNIFPEERNKKINDKTTYVPTGKLLNFLFSTDGVEGFYFGSFDWDTDPINNREFLTLEGIPNNSQRFLMEFDSESGVWKGKVIGLFEENETYKRLSFKDRFEMIEIDDEFRPPEELRLNYSQGESWIPFLQGHYGNNIQEFFLNGRTTEIDFGQFVRLQNKSSLGKVYLKNVIIQGRSFIQNLTGCNVLKILCLENVQINNYFVGFVSLPSLKEFNIMICHDFFDLLEISNYFNRERILSTLFFNQNSFENLWKCGINFLIGIANQRILEFDHENGSVTIQFIPDAKELITETGMANAEEKVQRVVIFYSSFPADITFPSSHLKYLNLTAVDVNISAIFEAHEFPCLETFFFEPMNEETNLDICKIPSCVKIVGLSGLTLQISTEYTTCDSITINNCHFPRYPDLFTSKLKFKKIALLGGHRFFPTCQFLRPLIKYTPNKCETVLLVNFLWKIQADELDHALFTSMGLNTSLMPSRFELNHKSKVWTARNVESGQEQNKVESRLTGRDIVPRDYVTFPHEIMKAPLYYKYD